MIASIVSSLLVLNSVLAVKDIVQVRYYAEAQCVGDYKVQDTFKVGECISNSVVCKSDPRGEEYCNDSSAKWYKFKCSDYSDSIEFSSFSDSECATSVTEPTFVSGPGLRGVLGVCKPNVATGDPKIAAFNFQCASSTPTLTGYTSTTSSKVNPTESVNSKGYSIAGFSFLAALLALA